MDLLWLGLKMLLTIMALICCVVVGLVGYDARPRWFLVSLGVILSTGYFIVIEFFGFVVFGNPGLTLLIWYLLSVSIAISTEVETTVTRHDHEE